MQAEGGWLAQDAKDAAEDCLYLTVATPSLHPSKPLPVILWIHGGGNYTGSGRYIDFQTMTDHGVVLVSINYRLGVFGFMAHPELTKESAGHASGNYGILDQIAALRWVHANIARFGGDPNNVTIAGQSAGSLDVGILLVSPVSKGLFQRAIEESGGPISLRGLIPTLHEGEGVGEKLGAFLGAPRGPGQLEVLRSMSARQLLTGTQQFIGPDSGGMSAHESPTLIVDGVVVTKQPTSAIHDGAIHPVPLLIGSNSVEFPFNRSSDAGGNTAEPADEVRQQIMQSFGNEASQAIVLYGLDKSDPPAPDPIMSTAGTQLMTDTSFRCPATIASQWLSDHGASVWQYEFQRPLPGIGSAFTRHGAELAYVFGWTPRTDGDLTQIYGASLGPQDVKLSRQLQAYWIDFAKTGNPNGDGLPQWPCSVDAPGQLMRFTSNGPVLGQNAKLNLCGVYATHLEEVLAGGEKK